MPNSVTVRYGSKGAKQVTTEVDKLHNKLVNIQKQGAKGLLLGFGAGVGLSAINAVGSAIRDVTGFVEDSAKAYMAEELSIRHLTTSLKANLPAWDGNTVAIEAQIKASEALGFQDDDLRNSLSLLVAATHSVPEAFKIQSAAMDLARFKGISLQDATEALTRVEAGSFRILKSLGIVLKDGATQTDALTAVEKVAAGQAADYATTLEGKLTVAHVKVNDAMEKLGKGFAEMGAVVLPAAADAIEGFVDGPLKDLQAAIDAIQHPDRPMSQTDWNNAILGPLAGNLSGPKQVLAGLKAGVLGASRAMGPFTDTQLAAMGAIDKSIAPTKTLAQAIDDMAAAARDDRTAIDGLATTIDEGLFGKAINAGHLADLQQTHAELVKQRKEIKDHTSPAYVILTGQIKENEQAQFDLQLQMKDEEGHKVVIAWLKTQITKFGDASGAIQRLIDKYQSLIRVQSKLVISGGVRSTGGGKRAGGGPVAAGEAYTVGERGIETFVPMTDGAIIPHGPTQPSGGSWGGGSVNVTFMLPNAYGMTPGQADALARTVSPILIRDMQKRGILARAL